MRGHKSDLQFKGTSVKEQLSMINRAKDKAILLMILTSLHAQRGDEYGKITLTITAVTKSGKENMDYLGTIDLERGLVAY